LFYSHIGYVGKLLLCWAYIRPGPVVFYSVQLIYESPVFIAILLCDLNLYMVKCWVWDWSPWYWSQNHLYLKILISSLFLLFPLLVLHHYHSDFGILQSTKFDISKVNDPTLVMC